VCVCVWCNNVCVVGGGSVHACIVCGVPIRACAHMRMCGVVYSAVCVCMWSVCSSVCIAVCKYEHGLCSAFVCMSIDMFA